MRLGVDEAGVTELMGVTEHTRCLGVVAAALGLERLADEPALVGALDAAATAGPVRALLDEIRAAHASATGIDHIPALWRVLARNVHYLESTWRKEEVVMRPGALSARDKRRVALGIAMNMGSRYMIEYHAAVLRQAGDTDEDLLEVLGVVDHYNCLNTLSDGMQIPSDIRPPS
jgi:alkylhydroperoxidase/carboxymuconolactone decarboxylase family protein YurZ